VIEKMKRWATMSDGKEFIAILEKYIEKIKPVAKALWSS
jgi:hypothetical protein